MVYHQAEGCACASPIRGNIALQNQLDLRDVTIDCSDPYERTNEWNGNRYTTHNPACIQ